MPKVLYKLNISVQIHEYLLVVNLENGVDATRKEHVGTVWLSCRACLLKHDRNHSTKVDEHGQFGLGCFVLVQLK